MSKHVCPWWLAYTFDNPFRRLFHNPRKMLGEYVKEGMTVLDMGCGMGYFSTGMAKMVGEKGRVLSVDLQPKMLDILARRAERAGVRERISPTLCSEDSIGVDEEVEFALAFWMVHEVPDSRGFFLQVSRILKPGGRLLFAEPRFHVSSLEFEKSVKAASAEGFVLIERPSIAFSRAALFESVKQEP